jgi:probable F420-dependent oxidoreductase
MRIGVTLRNIGGFAGGSGVDACLDIAQRAESLGFDSVWLGDHVVAPVANQDSQATGGRTFPQAWDQPVYDPLVLLSALAQATQRVQIGTAVLVLPYRHPLVTAKMLATADRLADGRIVFGVGAGWLQEEFRALGLPPTHFKQRGDVSDDYLRAIKEAWLNTGPARYAGEYVQFTDVGTFPHPVQTPQIPIWSGGPGQRAMLRAVRLGNGYIAVAADPASLGREVEELRRLAERDRRDPEELTVAMVSRIVVGERPPNSDAPALSGSPQQIAEALGAFGEAGLQHLIADVRQEGDASLTATLVALEAVAREVLPVVREAVAP